MIGSDRTRTPGGVERSVGDRGRGADDPDLPDAARAHRGGEVVLLLQPLRLQVEHVGVGRDVVGREVLGDDVTGARVAPALLVQRGGQAHRQGPQQLGPRGHGVDDAADRVDAVQPGDPHLAGPAVHAGLGEHRAEGVHRVAVGVGVGAARGGGVEPGVGGGAVVVAELLRGRGDGAAPRRGAGRAAGHRREREVGVADREVNAVRRDPQRVGGDLHQDGAGAGAEVDRADVDPVPTLAERPDPRGVARREQHGVRRRRDPRADPPVALGPGAGPGRSLRPAEPLGAETQALDETAPVERLAALGVDLRLVPLPQVDRVDVRGHGELVQCHLVGVHARHLPGRAHPGRHGHVERGHAVGRGAVGRGVHHAGRGGGLLGELLDARRLRRRVVAEHDEGAVGLGAEAHARAGGGAVAGEREHLLPRHGEAHRVAGERQGGEGRRDLGGVGEALAAEAATDVRREHAHLLRLEAQHRRERGAHRVHGLGGVVEGEQRAVPGGSGGVRLHRAVELVGRGVGRVDVHGGGGERRVGVTVDGVRLRARVDLLGGVGRAVLVEDDLGRLLVLVHPHEEGALAGGLRRGRDDERDDLPAETDVLVLEHGELAVLGVGEPGGAGVVEHAPHAPVRERVARVHPQHPSAGGGRGDEPGVQHVAVHRVLDRVRRRAGHLRDAVLPVEVPSHRPGRHLLGDDLRDGCRAVRAAHRAPPASRRSVWAVRLRTIATL
ncbi:hypothetical protein QE405_000973 [Nocardioides zeae]|uniref:Uncharacterized protein n=1 Tax=Nocardioides zeae TaxID=1457234 RepID=A0AAJ1X1Q7_9ACTN|nr:hypothetical protein [Nocardioides zeae]